MKISQKKFPNKFEFDFGDDELGYARKHHGERYSFGIRYSDIPAAAEELEEQNALYMYGGILWCLVGIFFSFYQYAVNGELQFSMWLVLGILCLIFYATSKTRYSVFATEQGTIVVPVDKKHDYILDEINTRRKRQLP